MRSIYLFLLASLVGIELALGMFVAPVIFYPSSLIGEGVLTHFQSGILMSQIFIKCNYALLFVAVWAILYELFYIKKDFCLHIKISSIFLALINLTLTIAFVYYFTDFILSAQAQGESATIGNAEFDAMHKASEYVMKLMIVSQILLFFMQGYKEKR